MNHPEKNIRIQPEEKNEKIIPKQSYRGDPLGWARVPVIPTVRFVPDKPFTKNIDLEDRSQSK